MDPALLTCQEEPPPPAGPVVTNRQGVKYTNDVKYAGADCRAKLGEVRQVVEETK